MLSHSSSVASNDLRADAAPPAVEAQAPALSASRSKVGSGLLCIQAIVLIALAQVLFAGYRLGVGNQTIQIPFLQKFLDPSLYPHNDPAVATRDDYPSFFYKGLAFVVGSHDIPTVYLILHLVTTVGVMLAAYALAKAIFKDALAGIVTAAILFAGHHRALAGDEMYSLGFTHTWAVFPLAILAMVLLYKDQLLLAFALAGIIFNLHALTAAYLVVMFGFWALFNIKEVGWKKLLLVGFVFLAISAPTIKEMAHRQVFDAQWVALTRIRSGDHSFPSTWWQPGTPDIPRFLLIAGLAVLSLSFPAERKQQRKSIFIGIAAAILFLEGILLADVKPVTLVLRAQLFRSSRLLMVLMFVHIAHNIAMGWRMPREKGEIVPGKWFEAISATATLLTLAVPPLLPYLPYAFALAVVVALVNGRLSWFQAIFSAAVGLTVMMAWRKISFPLPWSMAGGVIAAVAVFCAAGLWVISRLGLSRSSQALLIVLSVLIPVLGAILVLTAWIRLSELKPHVPTLGALIGQIKQNGMDLGRVFWIASACGLALWVASRLRLGRGLTWLLAVAGMGVCVMVPIRAERDLLASSSQANAWTNIQLWARDYTPKNAVFLTPPEQGGFRIHSERATVGEWRDGTQAYFSAGFAKRWWDNMKETRPGITYAGGFVIPGKELKDLPDKELVSIATQTHANYLILPRGKERKLRLLYQNDGYAVYTPELRNIFDASQVKMLPGVEDKELWIEQERFIQETCLPNIEKYRKGDVRVEIVDASGQPLGDVPYTVTQTRQAFGFGASLHFFAPVEGQPANGDYKPEPVTQKELDAFKQVFNYTVIPFSGKWAYIEPVEGKRTYAELDKYIDWCVKNHIEVEYHFLSGLAPDWLYRKMRYDSQEIPALYMKHAMEVVDRYADRVKTWQVLNDKYMLQYAAPVFMELRKRHPDLKLGMSDCTKFYSVSGNPEYDIYRGLDDVKSLRAQGASIDFFSMHGHSPHGLWPNWHQVYDSFQHFADQGLKVKVSEILIPAGTDSRSEGWFGRAIRGGGGGGGRIYGDVISGNWTQEMRAEFLERFYTVCFSNPACNAVNYWDLGPDSMTPGTGLLDEKYQPTPAFNRLKHLIKDEWMTHLPPGRTTSDGAVSFRGFHGDYQITVTLPSGKTATGTFSILPDGSNHYRLVIDQAKGTLAIQ